MFFKKHLLLAGFTAALLAAAPDSQAEIILRIDISNPTAVKFLSTSAFAENDGDTSTLSQGITLLNFFTADPFEFNPIFSESTLSSPTGEFAYTNLYYLPFNNTEGPITDLNIAGDGSSLQGFTTGSRALTGSATVDLSAWISLLTVGQIGDIHSSDGVDYKGPVIGQFEVVPEPATALLLTGAASFLYFARRRFK